MSYVWLQLRASPGGNKIEKHAESWSLVEDIYVSLLRFIILLTRNKEINLKFLNCNHDCHWLNPLLFFEKNASFNGATHEEIAVEVVLHAWKYCVVLRLHEIPIQQNTRSFMLFITEGFIILDLKLTFRGFRFCNVNVPMWPDTVLRWRMTETMSALNSNNTLPRWTETKIFFSYCLELEYRRLKKCGYSAQLFSFECHYELNIRLKCTNSSLSWCFLYVLFLSFISDKQCGYFILDSV